MSVLKEKSQQKLPPQSREEESDDEALRELKKKVRPEVYEAYKRSLKRFGKLYRLLAK